MSADVTQETNDKMQIAPALERLRAIPSQLGVATDIAADAGYFSAKNVQACEDAAIVPYISIRREKHHGWLAARLRKPLSEPAVDSTALTA